MSLRAAIDGRCLLEREGSGVTAYTRAMVNALSKDARTTNAQWTIFTSGVHTAKISLPWKTVPRHLRWSNTMMNFGISTLNFPSARYCLGSVDFFWQPNPMFFPRSDVPTIVTIHDLSFAWYPEFFDRHTRAWYLRYVMDWLKRAPSNTQLLAVSEYTRQDIITRFPRWRRRVTVQSQPPPLARPRSKKPAAPMLVAVGTLEPRKNLPPVVEAYKIFRRAYPEATLTFVGRMTPSARSYFRKHPMPHGMSIRGYLSNNERDQLYERATCLLYPSFYEGYGLPPLEAMARGVPVVASSTSALPEVLGDAAILIDPFRATEAIVASLEQLHEDSQFYDAQVARGYNRIAQLTEAFSLDPFFSVWPNVASV